MSIKVYLSPSTQMHNPGAVPGYIEGAQMYKVAQAAATHLRRQNTPGHIQFIVKVASKKFQAMDDYHGKHSEAQAWGAQLAVCLHSNAGNGVMRGTNGYYLSGMDSSRRLATDIVHHIVTISKIDDGVHSQTSWLELSDAPITAYIETMFHDNLADCQLILANIDTLGAAVAAGIVEYTKRG